jgi:hypothetical protein
MSNVGGRVLAACVAIVTLMPAWGIAQPAAPWVRARRLVSRTQNDVRRAASISPSLSSPDRDHFDTVLKHLSDFDRDLTRRRFNKGRLSDSIRDVQRILDHDTLAPRSRDSLQRDAIALRRLRADYDTWHD